MAKRITLIQGHPDPAGNRYGHALARAYALGAEAGGHELRRIEVARLDFPWLASKEAWDGGRLPAALVPAQEAIGWAEHLVFFFPLWLGTMPALLKAFLEQTLRPGFALAVPDAAGGGRALLSGRSARLVVTMGMPALWYRWYFRAHGLRGLERSILRFCGIGPIHETLIGNVETTSRRYDWLARVHAIGRDGV